jgi:aminopeptidase N
VYLTGLAHPIRPDSYVKMDNFYTPTVYEKGAEVVGTARKLIKNWMPLTFVVTLMK